MREDVVERLKQELRLLPILEGALSTPIPHFDYIGRGDTEYPYTFVGYRKIAGIPLGAESITPAQLSDLESALAIFLTELHGFPLDVPSLYEFMFHQDLFQGH